MKYTIALIALLSYATFAQDLSPQLSVEEIFSVQTSEELEAALTDGYPMPWLAEILEDETIPEEDRYWLDCRVRAVIAIELQTFFDENGNSVTFNTGSIKPGENYWRENYILSPSTPIIEEHRFSNTDYIQLRNGTWINRFGQITGSIAHSTGFIETSRDGALSAIAGYFSSGREFRLLIQPSDGNYIISSLKMEYGRATVSESGNYVLLSMRGKRGLWGEADSPNKVVLLNNEGEIIWENELEMLPIGNITPAISPNDRYCAIVTQAEDIRTADIRGMLQVFDTETGRELWRIENPNSAQLSFSPNSKFINISGKEAITIEIATGDNLWSNQSINTNSFPVSDLMYLNCSNSIKLLSGMIWPSSREGSESVVLTLFNHEGQVLAEDNLYGSMDISPNGFLTITENYQPRTNRMVCPVIVRRIVQGGE